MYKASVRKRKFYYNPNTAYQYPWRMVIMIKRSKDYWGIYHSQDFMSWSLAMKKTEELMKELTNEY